MSPRLSTSSTLPTRPLATREMWSRPSLPGVSFTKAPKSLMPTTSPSKTSPTSGSFTMPRIMSLAACMAVPETAPTWMVPSSWMSMEAPVSSWMPRTTLPPEPMTSRILSTGILMVSMRGAVSFISARGPSMVSSMAARMKARPSWACFRARARISTDRPFALLSICRAVMPLGVPQTLKSMSPRKSSMPWMSERMTTSSPSLMRPMATPETGAEIGTPASIRARQLPHVEAMEEEPLDSSTSETTRMA